MNIRIAMIHLIHLICDCYYCYELTQYVCAIGPDVCVGAIQMEFDGEKKTLVDDAHYPTVRKSYFNTASHDADTVTSTKLILAFENHRRFGQCPKDMEHILSYRAPTKHSFRVNRIVSPYPLKMLQW